MAEMTEKGLVRLCRELGLYSTPSVNDILYVHYKGYKEIACLEGYTDLKVIYLEGNAFSEIKGLNHLKMLRSLYLQENCLTKIENIDQLVLLDTINLNQNFITKVEGLSTLTKLGTLTMQNNKLNTLESVAGVLECPSLMVLDVQKNNISDPKILDVLEQMPNLRVLYMKDNPCVEKIKMYRKTCISRLKHLTYLDDRPVFEEERLLCEAWAKGGIEAEKEERKRQKAEKQAKEQRQFKWFEGIVQDAKDAKAKKDAEKAEEKKTQELVSEVKNNDEDDEDNDKPRIQEVLAGESGLQQRVDAAVKEIMSEEEKQKMLDEITSDDETTSGVTSGATSPSLASLISSGLNSPSLNAVLIEDVTITELDDDLPPLEQVDISTGTVVGVEAASPKSSSSSSSAIRPASAAPMRPVNNFISPADEDNDDMLRSCLYEPSKIHSKPDATICTIYPDPRQFSAQNPA